MLLPHGPASGERTLDDVARGHRLERGVRRLQVMMASVVVIPVLGLGLPAVSAWRTHRALEAECREAQESLHDAVVGVPGLRPGPGGDASKTGDVVPQPASVPYAFERATRAGKSFVVATHRGPGPLAGDRWEIHEGAMLHTADRCPASMTPAAFVLSHVSGTFRRGAARDVNPWLPVRGAELGAAAAPSRPAGRAAE